MQGVNSGVLRYSDVRLDASSIKELPDGSIKVTGQLTHPGLFTYKNLDGTDRVEYRPAAEVFRADSMATFAGAPITLGHPAERKVTAASWRRHAIGHAGDSLRQDSDHAVVDLYVRDEAAVAGVKSGKLKFLSAGYHVDFDPTPGTTPDGLRYDGIQKNIRGNHIALLPQGIAPRGGESCVLRLDSEGDERIDEEGRGVNSGVLTQEQIDALQAQVTVLTGEVARLRTDAAEVVTLRESLATATADLATARAASAPAALDARIAQLAKRKTIVERTPALATRVDSFSDETVDALIASYADAPHPSHKVLGTPPATEKPATETRTDAAPAAVTSDLAAKAKANSDAAFKSVGFDNQTRVIL